MPTPWSIADTSETVYRDPIKGIVNGVLVRFTMTAYNEIGSVRVPELDPETVRQAIDKYVAARDALAKK